MHFSHPRIKEGCEIRRESRGIILAYFGEDLSFEVDDPNQIASIESLIRLWDGSRTIDEIIAAPHGLDAVDVETALSLLDANLLLTEGAEASPGKHGLTFITELEDFYYNVWMRADGETNLVKAIFDGTAEREVLLGWGLESFHVTSRAHDCLSPMIARFHGAFKRKAIDYFLDEYRHDKLLMKSLLAAGFEREAIQRSLPLPYTHATMNLLAKWANTDLLSFMACLFVFEGTPEIGNAYIDSLAQYDLPAGFVKGQSVHNDINSDGDHGNISRDFFAMIDQVSTDDQARVVRNLRLLYETQRRKHDNVLQYYLAPTIGIPRLLPDAGIADPVGGVSYAA